MAKGGSDPESTVSKPCTVFIDTNLNTHLAMSVSDEDTVRDLKQKIMSEHTHCFPKIGEITIQAMKVRRKACFYHLSDSMLVKCAFNGVNRTWFLYVDAASSQLVPTENRLYSEPGSSSLPNCFHITDGPSAETEKNNIQFDHQSKMISTLAHEGQFIPGDMGEVSAGLDLGRKSFSLEHNTTSSGANKRTVSGKRKQHDPVSNENEVPGTHTDESGKIRDMQFDDILEEAPQLEPAKKKQRKEKANEDDFSYSVRDPSKGSDAGNVDADSLLAMEKGENNGNKVGSEANIPEQAVPSGGGKANRVKKHMVGSAKGLNLPLVGESDNPNGDITPLISDAGVPDDDNIGTVPNDKTEVKEKALPPNGDPELVFSSVPDEAEMNIKGGVASPGPMDASDIIKIGNLGEKRKRRSKKTTKASVARKNISGVKHVDEEADPLRSKSDKAFHGDHSGHETKTNDDNLARVEKEGLLRIKDGGTGDDNIDTDQIDTAEKEEKGLSMNGDPKLMSSKGTGMNHKSTVRSEEEVSDKDMMVSSKLLDASGLVKARVHGDKGKKLKKTKTSDATIGVSTSGVENGLSERDVIPVRSELDKAFDSGHPAIETKKEGTILSQTGKSRTSKMESVNAPSLGLEKEADKGSENEARVHGDKGKKLKKTKTSDATIGVSTSGVENGLSERNVIPVRSELDKAFDSGHPAIETKKEGTILSQTGKSRTSKMESVNAPSLGLEKEADKGSENEARVRGDKGKKLKKTKTSDATIGVSTSGVENGLSERDVIPIRSEPDKAFDSGHPAIETKKEGTILSQTGKSRTSKMESVNAPSLSLEKEADKGSENEDNSLQLTQITHFQETADYRDEKVKMKSVKTKYSTSKSNPDPPKELKVAHSGDLTPSNDENKKEENAPSKKVKKSRLGKPTLVNKLSESLPEVEKDSAVVTELSQYQISRNNGSSQIPSDTLQHNWVKRPLEENDKEDDYLVNGCTDEDNSHMEASNADDDELDFSEYIVPEPDHHEVAPAKGFVDQDTEIRASDKKLKALHPKKKDKKLKANKHSVGPMADGHEILYSKENQGNKKKPDGDVSKTVQGSLSKDEQNKPAPQPEIEAFPHKVSRKNTVNAATATPVQAHRTRSSTMASSVDSVHKNEKKGLGNLQSRKDQYHIAVKRFSSNKMGEVLNNSKREKSLLATSNTIFEDSGTESSQDEGEVNNSEASTRSPSDDSSSYSSEFSKGGEDDTNLDSPGNGSYGGKGKDNSGNDVTMSQSKNMTLDMLLRSSSSYKKAKLRVSESQLEDTENEPEIVWDSQV